MAEKRFHIINDAGNLQKYGILCKPVVVDNETDKKYILALDLLDLLNNQQDEIQRFEIDLEDMVDIKNKYKKERGDYYEMFLDVKKENEQLKIKLEDIALDMENAKESNDDAQYELYKIKKENEKLKKEKERYKRLSEIRREEINNRILTIKEFINNCSDNKVRSVLKELFYSEVNEYDLSSENRKLLHENEQLKNENSNLMKEVAEYSRKAKELEKENEQLKASLYAEKTNTAEVVNDYSKQFKRHSTQFSFMMDLADDLGVDVTTLEALDD